jgi:hypothetical protein
MTCSLSAALGTFIRLPKSEAARLPNRTYPIADEPGFYIAQFDVFHQLHCLVSCCVKLCKNVFIDI